MSLKVVAQFFKDLWAYLKKILSSRVIPFVIIMVLLFSILIHRLFTLQIINGESYKLSYTMKTQREVTTIGPRGNIYDRNGVLLAYSELAYSVVIEDCGYYESSKIKNKTLNNIIAETINIIEENGDTINFSFPIENTTYMAYRFTTEGNALQRFLRDIYGHKSINELTEEEKNATADQVINYLCSRYQIDKTAYSRQMVLNIIYVRYNLAANSYKRYISFTIAQNVSPETMASILESSSELIGVGIEEEYVRKYNYSTYMAHIIGYTGKVNETELEELQQIDSSYSANDIVGKAGIEATYETTLAGKKGSVTMLVDTVGRVQEITSEVAAQVGNDIYLTIDVELQKKIYDLLERRLSEILVTNIVESDVTQAGLANMIVLPVTRVYFALINNNVIDYNKIARSDTPAARTVYSVFSARKENNLSLLTSEMETGTPYAMLSEDMKSFVKRMRSLLLEMNILDSEKITSGNELSKQWSSGNISFRDYLIGAINNDWININNLDVNTDYPTTDEVITAVTELVLKEIEDDSEFNKLIYEDLILSRTINGNLICMILMEQNAVEHTESEYVAISNGASAYNFIMDKISRRLITPAQLAIDPCSGSCVLENPNNGELLALVSYPSYDNNYFSGTIDSAYYQKLLADKSTPLVNRATHTKIAPGSTFKPLTALAAITEGVVAPNEAVYCSGEFDNLKPSIKCWSYPNEHGGLATEEALQRSCNVYFCEMGYRLSITPSGTLNLDYGLSRLKKYAELLGLATKSGIQIPETTPRPSDYNSAASAMGQGTNAYTSLNLARYVSTIANKGTVYNSNLITKITDSDKNILYEQKPVISNTVDIISDSTFNTVQNGMQRVISQGIFKDLTGRLPVTRVCGKSGTAEEDKTRGNHACYIMFTQDETGNPEVVTSVMLPYAYAASNAGIMAFYALASYYNIDVPQSIHFDIDGSLLITE